jgi:hypothetical protein
MKKLIAVALLAMSFGAHAGFDVTVNDYLGWGVGQRYGYIMATINTDDNKKYCVPYGVSSEQLNVILTKDFKDRPQQWHVSLETGFFLAMLHVKWLCR